MTATGGTGRRWPAVVAAARSCVGTCFRPQGRTPGLGLDCVGVVLVAARAAGIEPVSLPVYTLGGEQSDMLLAGLVGAGCTQVEAAAPGDILAFAPGHRQRHLAVVVPGGMVHAHAGLGRVVEGPRDHGWTLVGAWRLPGAY